MKNAYATLLSFIFILAGCKGDQVDVSSLKPAATRTAGKLTIVLLNKTGELTQGQNDFIVEFKDDQGRPVDVGDVQIGSSMSMPGMAPMSGDSGVTKTNQTGIYKVASNFAMSGAWHFALSWDGPAGQAVGRFGGYGLYLLKGKPVFVHNLADFVRFRWEGKEALTSGKHTIAFDFTYDGPGFGKGGTGVLKVDGKEVASK